MAHAEIALLRLTLRTLRYEQFAQAALYSSTEPCLIFANEIITTPIATVEYRYAADPAGGGPRSLA
jgi:tRNA(Arg) A34 adenosine deaminase TadA